MGISLSEDLVDDIRLTIQSMMDHYHRNDDGADSRCEFCGQEPTTNYGPIKHSGTCEGVRIIAALDAATTSS